MEEKRLLENILAAQILILGQQLKQEKAAKGVSSTSDFTSEAAALIDRRRAELLRLLR